MPLGTSAPHHRRAKLRAQSFALENISGNIANSQTTAFKREDTSFVDLIPDEQPTKQLAGSVIANSRATNTVQGDIQSATISTFMAINGSGFFVVEKPATFTDNRPVFDGTNLYTRRGDFQPNKDGYLVNGAGYYLMGHPGRSDDRKPGRQRAAAASIPERLPAGAGHHRDRLSRQSRVLSVDAQARHKYPRVRAARSAGLHLQLVAGSQQPPADRLRREHPAGRWLPAPVPSP
jgi:flagellar hook-basal body protein